LTFDDGPDPTYTPQVLTILEQYHVHATFFCVGDHVQDSPELVRQEHAAGHIVANHSWNHPDLTTLSADEVHTQLSMTSDAIEQATGVRPTFFRPPYGVYNEQTLAQTNALGLTAVTWNVDPDDWQEPESSAIIDRVLEDAGNGAIILLHDGGGDRTQTIAALPKILTKLQERGFRFVTLQQMTEDMTR
jgi:peptidoglycan-N-acetylglucosamine deacetylase